LWTWRPPSLSQAAIIAELRAVNAAQAQAIAALEARVAELERRLGKDFSNTSERRPRMAFESLDRHPEPGSHPLVRTNRREHSRHDRPLLPTNQRLSTLATRPLLKASASQLRSLHQRRCLAHWATTTGGWTSNSPG
jgi:hypothetical protein